VKELKANPRPKPGRDAAQSVIQLKRAIDSGPGEVPGSFHGVGEDWNEEQGQ
jgi:hypothetical protein